MNTPTTHQRVGGLPAFLILVLLFAFAIHAISSQAKAYPPPVHPDNGVFLGKVYVADSTYATTNTTTLCTKMKAYYGVQYFFVNVGKLDSNGRIMNANSELTQLVSFLNTVKSWENSNAYQFKVIAWVSGNVGTATSSSPYFDVGNPTMRATLIATCQKLVSSSVPGSLVSTANRSFDGVLLDLEPSGQNSTRFNNIVTLMSGLRSTFNGGGLASKLTGFAAHKYGQQNEYQWSEVFYYYMARQVDLLVSMCYDSGITTGSSYTTWMQNQTTSILRAVSGVVWNNDVNHPAPTNDVRVFIGFPAYPTSAYHSASSENISYAGPGVEKGLGVLTAAGDVSSLSYFQGASVYAQTDGTGSDSYASWSLDWWNLGRYWLHTW